MSRPIPPRVEKLPAAKQRRLDELLEKYSEGTITPREKAPLEQLVGEAERLMVANARRLAKFAKAERGGARRQAPFPSPSGSMMPVSGLSRTGRSSWLAPQEGASTAACSKR